MTEGPSDEFDRIVEGLDLDSYDSDFLDHDRADDPSSSTRPITHPSGARESTAPRNHLRMFALWSVLGTPLGLVVATMSGLMLPRSVVLAAALIFVAGSIYLISQLPEHGPGHPDWPDDGAVL